MLLWHGLQNRSENSIWTDLDQWECSTLWSGGHQHLRGLPGVLQPGGVDVLAALGRGPLQVQPPDARHQLIHQYHHLYGEGNRLKFFYTKEVEKFRSHLFCRISNSGELSLKCFNRRQLQYIRDITYNVHLQPFILTRGTFTMNWLLSFLCI